MLARRTIARAACSIKSRASLRAFWRNGNPGCSAQVVEKTHRKRAIHTARHVELDQVVEPADGRSGHGHNVGIPQPDFIRRYRPLAVPSAVEIELGGQDPPIFTA